MLTRLSSYALVFVVAANMFGATGAGILIGRSLAKRRAGLKEPLGVMQGALVALVALLLAWLDDGGGPVRNAAERHVLEANAIGTTYLRAQTLAEPMRTKSLALLSATATHASRCPSRSPTRRACTPRR